MKSGTVVMYGRHPHIITKTNKKEKTAETLRVEKFSINPDVIPMDAATVLGTITFGKKYSMIAGGGGAFQRATFHRGDFEFMRDVCVRKNKQDSLEYRVNHIKALLIQDMVHLGVFSGGQQELDAWIESADTGDVDPDADDISNQAIK